MPVYDIILYVNSSHEDGRYVREAQASAASFRRHLPNARFVLGTDAGTVEPVDNFDEVVRVDFTVPDALRGTDHKNGQMVAKLRLLNELVFDRLLYLGSDTYALDGRVTELFSLLDRFDMAAAHAPHRVNTAEGRSHVPHVPTAFPEFNCDVLAIRNRDEVASLLEKWERLYLTNVFGHAHDQGAFRYLAYTSDICIATLPPEFNYRGTRLRRDVVVLQNRDLLPVYRRFPRSRWVGALDRLDSYVAKGLRAAARPTDLT